jgi:flavin-dependent dehydrogenase
LNGDDSCWSDDYLKAESLALREIPDMKWDAVVFGSGPAACVFALAMARHGRSTLIVSANVHDPPRQPRGETLAPRGAFLLGQIGIGSRSLKGHLVSDRILSCWATQRLEVSDISFDPHGCMWHLDRNRFDDDLFTEAFAQGVEVLKSRTIRILGLKRQSDTWHLRVKTTGAEHALRSKYLVDATGKCSLIAKRLGANRILRDRLVAILSTTSRQIASSSLLIEPVSRGWWYSLGYGSQGVLALGLITDPSSARLAGKFKYDVFHSMLKEASHTQARVADSVFELRAISAEISRLDQLVGDGWVAIGDAAMSFDPLSSHGLSNAIEQAIDIAAILSGKHAASGLTQFHQESVDLFAKYRNQRVDLYSQVTRFSKETFWQNRIRQ